MFEGLEKPRRPMRKLDKQALLVYGVAALVLMPAAYLYWRSSNESAALETLDEVRSALVVFHERFKGYPDTLERLRGQREGSNWDDPPEHARLLPRGLAHDEFSSSGYTFRYRGKRKVFRWAATVQLYDGFELTAVPMSWLTASTHLATVGPGEILEADDPAELAEALRALEPKKEDEDDAEGETNIEITATPAED